MAENSIETLYFLENRECFILSFKLFTTCNEIYKFKEIEFTRVSHDTVFIIFNIFINNWIDL